MENFLNWLSRTPRLAQVGHAVQTARVGVHRTSLQRNLNLARQGQALRVLRSLDVSPAW